MRSWPTAPIIRIVKGFAFGGRHIRDEYALRTFDGAYVIDGARLEASVDSDTGDSIDAWEDIAPVPADDLKNLRDEFRGAPISERRLRALLQVTSNLPPKTVTPMDRAVLEVEEDLSRSMRHVRLGRVGGGGARGGPGGSSPCASSAGPELGRR